jgi:hypothetical protein
MSLKSFSPSMKSSYNSTQVTSSLHLALVSCINLMYLCIYLVYNFHFYFSPNWYLHLAAEYRSDYCLWTNIYTEFLSSHVPLCLRLCVCLLICYSIYQFGGYYSSLYCCFYYVRPDSLLVLYRRKTELILSLIHFINTTFSTCFMVARIYIVPKMRLNNKKCHFILLLELCNLKNEIKHTTNCDTWMETSSKPIRG